MPKQPSRPGVYRPSSQSPGRVSQAGLRNVLKALAHDVAPVPAARGALSIIREGPRPLDLFERTCKALPEPVVHAVLDQLETDRRSHAFWTALARAAGARCAAQRQWRMGVRPTPEGGGGSWPSSEVAGSEGDSAPT